LAGARRSGSELNNADHYARAKARRPHNGDRSIGDKNLKVRRYTRLNSALVSIGRGIPHGGTLAARRKIDI
jgi:hypothetical protein